MLIITIHNYFQGSQGNFTLPRVPKTNFVYKISRAQGGMFVGKIGQGNPWSSIIFDFAKK